MFNTGLNRHPLTRLGRWGALAALLAIALPIAAVAQESFATVYGVVVDPMDRVLPGTTIKLTDEQRQVTHEVRADGAGRFELVGLPGGEYSLDARSPGFTPRRLSFNLSGGSLERNLKMEIGSLQETITVTGESAVAPSPARPTGVPNRRALPECSPTAVGGNLRPPHKLRDVRPVYPGVDGHVTLAARIATDGSVAEVLVTRSDRPELEAPAIAAVSQWQFDETLLNCVPVEVRMNVDIDFKPAP